MIGQSRHALKRYQIYLEQLQSAADEDRHQDAWKFSEKIEMQRRIYLEHGGWATDPRYRECEERFQEIRRSRPTPQQMSFLRGLGYDGGVFDLTFEQAHQLISTFKNQERYRQAQIAAAGRLQRCGSVTVEDLQAYGRDIARMVVEELHD